MSQSDFKAEIPEQAVKFYDSLFQNKNVPPTLQTGKVVCDESSLPHEKDTHCCKHPRVVEALAASRSGKKKEKDANSD